MTAGAAIALWLLGVAPAAALQKLYVATLSAGSVGVVDVDRRLVIERIPVGRQPDGIAAAPDGSAVYVANFADATVSIIDPATDSVAAVVPVDPGPVGLAVHPDGRTLYVACKTVGTLAVIDTARRAAVASIAVGEAPNAVALSPTGEVAYVARSAGATIAVVDTVSGALRAPLETAAGPNRLALSGDGLRLYVSHATGTIEVLRTDEPGAALFTNHGGGTAIALAADERWVYGAGAGGLIAATPELEIQRTACGGVAPYDLLALADGRVIAADMRGDALYFFAAGLENPTLLPLDGGPFALAALPAVTPGVDLAIESPPFATRLDAAASVGVRVSVRPRAQTVTSWTLHLRGADRPERRLASGAGPVLSALVAAIDGADLTPGIDYELVLSALAGDQTTTTRRVPLRVVPRDYALVPLEPSRGRASALTAAMDATGSRFARWPEPQRLVIDEPAGAGAYTLAPPLPFRRSFAPPLLSRDGRRVLLTGEVDGRGQALLWDLAGGETFDLPALGSLDLDGGGARVAAFHYRGGDESSAGWNYDLYDVAAGTVTAITDTPTMPDVPPVCRPAAAAQPRLSLAGDRVAFFTALPLGDPPGCNLYGYDVASGRRRLVAAFGDAGPLLAPTLDDAGARLALLRRPPLQDGAYPLRPQLIDLASGASQEILADPAASALAAAISGDGAAVVIASCADLDPAVGNPDFNEELFRYDVATQRFTQITDTRGGPQDCWARRGDPLEPRVSRDAAVIAFRGLGAGPATCGDPGAQRDAHSGFAFGDARAVRIDAANTPPRLTIGNDVLAAIGAPIEIAASASDADGDRLAWFAELDALGELPATASFQESPSGAGAAVFRWTGTTPADVGSHELRIGAFDGRGGDDVRALRVTVCRFVPSDRIGDVLSAIFGSQPPACGTGDANRDGVASAADLLVRR